MTNTKPGDADVARVRARLAGGGWPLASSRQRMNAGCRGPAFTRSRRSRYHGSSRPSLVKVPVGRRSAG